MIVQRKDDIGTNGDVDGGRKWRRVGTPFFVADLVTDEIINGRRSILLFVEERYLAVPGGKHSFPIPARRTRLLCRFTVMDLGTAGHSRNLLGCTIRSEQQHGSHCHFCISMASYHWAVNLSSNRL